MGKRRNRRKKANKKQIDLQRRIGFSSNSRIQEDYRYLSQNEKSNEYYEKISRSTTGNKAPSKESSISKTGHETANKKSSSSKTESEAPSNKTSTGKTENGAPSKNSSISAAENETISTSTQIKYETLHCAKNNYGGKDPVKSYNKPDGFGSNKRFPWKNFDDSLTEEFKCIGFYEHEVKENSQNKLASPEWRNKAPSKKSSSSKPEKEAPSKKTGNSTTGNEAPSTARPINLHYIENNDGRKASVKSCIKPEGFESKKIPSKNFEDSLMEETKCAGFYGHEVKNSQNKLASPEWRGKTSRGGLCNYTYKNYPNRSPRKRFEEVLNRWIPVRDKSIRKLRTLLGKVSEDEATYDNLDLNLKYGSQFCKREKVVCPPSSGWQYLFSVGSFVCDLAGGLSSVSHMINTDNIQKEFQEAMNEDADATKEMYEARSRYIKEYQYTEEIIRRFDGTTLGETLAKISETIGITEFFQRIEKARNNKEDIVMSAITALDAIMTRNCNRSVGSEVTNAIQELVDSNPACVGAAAGAGKSLYGAADLLVKSATANNKMSRALVAVGTKRLDMELWKQEQSDIRELERKIKGGSRTTLERSIQEALDMFEEEKNEMLELLRKLQKPVAFTAQYL